MSLKKPSPTATRSEKEAYVKALAAISISVFALLLAITNYFAGRNSSAILNSTISLLEGGISDAFVNLDGRNVNLGLSGNDVSLIDTLDGNTVNLVRTSDQQQARFELLQEDNATTSKTTSQQDQNGTRSNRRAQLGHFCEGVREGRLEGERGKMQNREKMILENVRFKMD